VLGQAFSSSAHSRVTGVEAGEQCRELIHEGLQKPANAIVGYGVGIVDQSGLEGDIGLAAHDEGAEDAQNLTQMLLGDGGADRTGRSPRNRGLSFQPNNSGRGAARPNRWHS
jgi:hypothetical protein